MAPSDVKIGPWSDLYCGHYLQCDLDYLAIPYHFLVVDTLEPFSANLTGYGYGSSLWSLVTKRVELNSTFQAALGCGGPINVTINNIKLDNFNLLIS